MARFPTAVVLGFLALLVLTGCTVPVNGLTGITVDGHGNLTALLARCDDNPPDGATIYISTGFNGKTVATYRAPKLTGHMASVRLDAPAAGWTAEPHAPALQPGIQYTIYGWTEDNSASTTHLAFRVTDRDRLSDETVLIQTYDEVGDRWVDTVISQVDFQRRAETYC